MDIENVKKQVSIVNGYAENIVDIVEKIRRTQAGVEEISLQVLDLIPVFIFVKDDKGRVIFGNKFFFDTMGLSSQDILNKTPEQWMGTKVSKEVLKNFLENDKKVLQGETTIRKEPLPNNPDRMFVTKKIPFPSPDGSIHRIIGVSIEVEDD